MTHFEVKYGTEERSIKPLCVMEVSECMWFLLVSQFISELWDPVKVFSVLK